MLYNSKQVMVFEKLRKQTPANPKEYLVALDIGTEVVKALIAEVKDDELEVIGVGRKQQEMGDMHMGAISDIAGVVSNCEAALSEAEDKAGVQGKRVIIGIAGELVKGVTNTIRYRRPQPNKTLDVAEIEFIIEKVQERAQVKAQAQIGLETGNQEVEVKLVNSALVSIHIDGYKVSNPIGFQGRDVAVQIYTAFAPMVHIGALEKVADELALDLVAVAAEPFAVSRSVLGTDTDSNFTAILADIGGGTTDIAVVNDGGVEGTKMFGIGGRSFTRTIANELEVSFKDAEKLKLSLNEQYSMKPSVRKRVEESIEKTLEVWLSGVQLALSEFENIDYLPNRILLCGGGSSLKRITEVLSEKEWHEDLPFTKKPVVQYIEPGDVTGIVDRTGAITDHTFVTAMGLLRVGYDTMVGSESANGLVERVNRLLKI